MIVTGMGEEIINIHDDDDGNNNNNNYNSNVSNKLTETPSVATWRSERFFCVRKRNVCREIGLCDQQCSASLSLSRPVPVFCLFFKIQ